MLETITFYFWHTECINLGCNAVERKNKEKIMEYVKFENKNWGYAGDKGTWAAFSGKTLKVKRAAKGIISSALEAEMQEFCSQYGIDFSAVKCGQTVSADIK